MNTTLELNDLVAVEIIDLRHYYDPEVRDQQPEGGHMSFDVGAVTIQLEEGEIKIKAPQEIIDWVWKEDQQLTLWGEGSE